MKIAALADIHGNYQSLVTILDHIGRRKPDLVFVLGDITNRGPRSRECLHLIQEREKEQGWQIIKGNHEGYVLNFLNPAYLQPGIDFELGKVIYWTYQSLTEDELVYLRELPEEVSLDLENGQAVRAFHASSAGDRIGIYPGSTEEELRNKVDPEADLFLVGHTHQPIIRLFQNTVFNKVESVGLPFDGDKRGAYAQFTYHKDQWRGEITRVEYDLPAAVEDFQTSGFIPDGGPLAEIILAELKLGWPQLSSWFRRFESAVLTGEITLQDAVEEFLKYPHIEQARNDTAMSFP